MEWLKCVLAPVSGLCCGLALPSHSRCDVRSQPNTGLSRLLCLRRGVMVYPAQRPVVGVTSVICIKCLLCSMNMWLFYSTYECL